mgnify:CR=1 FL=1
MTTYVALLRAVNVGGTGKLPMAALVAMCEDAGFARVRTYIASGNVVFDFKGSEPRVKALLAPRLAAHAGKAVAVLVRTAAEMAAVQRANPFAAAPPNRVLVTFLDQAPAADALTQATGQAGEMCHLGVREIYVRYGDAMADSKLKISAALAGTARNMNTVARLAAMAAS